MATETKPPSTTVGLVVPLHSIISTAGAVACAVLGWSIPAFLLAMSSIAFTSAWINMAYRARVRAEGKAPGWLTALETIRAYLGNEEPDTPETVR